MDFWSKPRPEMAGSQSATALMELQRASVRYSVQGPLHWWLGVARVQRERAVSSKSGKQASCHSETGGVASCSRGLVTPLGHTGRATLAVPPKHTCRCSARTEGERESRKGGRRAQDGDTH